MDALARLLVSPTSSLGSAAFSAQRPRSQVLVAHRSGSQIFSIQKPGSPILCVQKTSSSTLSAHRTRSQVCHGKLPIVAASAHHHTSRECVPKFLVCPHSCSLHSFPPLPSLRFASSSLVMTPLLGVQGTEKHGSLIKGGGALGTICGAAVRACICNETLRWIFVAAATLLFLVKDTGVHKAFLVPLLALELPRDIFLWMRGNCGLWAAFSGLFVRLFNFIPEELAELELPLNLLLLVIVAPIQAMKIRGTPLAAMVSLVMAGILAYQHFSWSGSIKRSCQQGIVLASMSILVLLGIPIVFFMRRL